MNKPTFIPMNLQYFAEGEPTGETGTDTGAIDSGAVGTGDVDFSAILGGDTGQGEGQPAQQPQTGGDKTFTQAEVDRIIGERLGREREKYQGFDQTQTQLQALQKYGYNLSDVVAHLEQTAQEQYQQQLQQQAQDFGVAPQILQKLSEYEQRFVAQDYAEAQRTLNTEIDRIGKDPQFGEFFKQNETEILQTALKLGTSDLESAMGKVFLKKYPEIRQQATQAGEQQAIRQIQQRGATQVDGSAQSGETGAGVQLSNEQLAMAKNLGINPQDYAKRLKK